MESSTLEERTRLRMKVPRDSCLRTKKNQRLHFHSAEAKHEAFSLNFSAVPRKMKKDEMPDGSNIIRLGTERCVSGP